MEFNKAYNRQEFMQFLQNSFLPEDFKPTLEPVTFSTQMKYSSETVKLGTSDTLDLVVYEIKHTSKHDARVALSKEAFRLLNEEMEDRALVIFVPEDCNDNYRLSFIEVTLDIAGEGNHRVSKGYSNPRRYSYFLGKGIAYYTPNKYLNEKGRVVDDEDLHSRFSVEVLTKEFYNELSDWYAWAIQIIRFPNDINDNTDDAKYNNESAIRLITRLIFVWFLKQRRLIPDEFFDEKFIANNLIEGFNPHAKVDLFSKSKESKYYKAILQNLFFAMLNSPITAEGSDKLSERHFRNGRGDYDNNKLMRYEDYFSNPHLFINLANQTVPFLNGGLFDCLDDKDNGMYYDGFSDRESIRNSLILPDYLFFGEEVGKNIDLSEWYGDKNKKKVSARGIVDILKRYNFTVEENTPFDQEVSLDPELLGKVFENLLASFNPETQTTARKQTGSFYTPREIVQYMVDESLIAHLKRTVGDELEPQFRQLLQYSDEEVDLTKEQRKSIMQSLYNCKILDPACGSGAFPMGMLQQMVHILGRIDPDNEQWKEMMMNQAINETTEAFKSATKEERQEQIADIERSFDEGVNRPDYARKLYLIENCIYGVDIQPIAIQISKLRFFISLVVDQKTNADPTDNFGIRPLPNLEAKFVAANTLIGITSDLSLADQSKSVQTMKQQLKMARHKIFSAKTVRTKRKYKQQVNDLRIAISSELESLGFIDETETSQLASWDMFDQDASSSFFDPDWMFGVRGFDIVIGNPPYVFTRDVDFGNDFKKYIDKEYFSKVKILGKKTKANQSGKINLYSVFLMKGITLCSKGGNLNYIVPNNLLRTTTYDIVRKYILDNTCINQILDLGSGVFDNVTASTIIIQISNVINKLNEVHSITGINNFELRAFESSYILQSQFGKNTSYTFNIYGDEKTNELSLKIMNGRQRLGTYCKDIIEGIVAHKKLIKDDLEEGCIPLLVGKRIKRYYNLSENKYILWDKGLIHRTRPDYLWELKEKILIQRISGGAKPIKATIDNKKCKTFASINNLVLKDMYDNKYKIIVAILNSNVVNWYYANNYSNNSKLTVNISKTYLEKLPIPEISKEIENQLNDLVNIIMEKKSIDSNTDTSKEEQEIDLIVYKLYGLTYDEVKVVDSETSITEEEYEAMDD